MLVLYVIIHPEIDPEHLALREEKRDFNAEITAILKLSLLMLVLEINMKDIVVLLGARYNCLIYKLIFSCG